MKVPRPSLWSRFLVLIWLPVLGIQPCLAEQGFPGWQQPVEIGAALEPEEEVFGWIGDVEADEEGNVFVLDRYAMDVRWFDRTAKLRGRVGGDGQGPGEFRAPLALAIDGFGRVHVLDRGNSRVSIFRPGAEGLALEADYRIGLLATDFCVLGERTFLLVPSSEHLIHEVDAGGRAIRSFGEPIRPDPDVVARLGRDRRRLAQLREHTSYGLMACDLRTNSVLLVHRQIPYVRSFSSEGEEQWPVRLEDYSETRWSVTRNGGCCTYLPDPTTNRIDEAVALAVSPSSELLLTLRENELSGRGSLEVRRLRMSDGTELARDRGRWRIAAEHRSVLVGFEQYPYPRLAVYGR